MRVFLFCWARNIKVLLIILYMIQIQLLGAQESKAGRDTPYTAPCPVSSNPDRCQKDFRSREIGEQESHMITGIISHVRDGDTIEVDGIPIRLAALDCPEKNTKPGQEAARAAESYENLAVTCELTGARTYDRFVGYCKVDGDDLGELMINYTDCTVWEKYDIWDRY